MAQHTKKLVKRYHKLVDKRVRKKITRKEKRELDAIERTLNINELGEKRYKKVLCKVKKGDRELARVEKLKKRIKELLALGK